MYVCAVYACVSCVMCAPTVRLLSTVRCPSEPRASLLSGGRRHDMDGLRASSWSYCFLCNLLAPAAQGTRPAQSGPKPCRASLASLSLSPVPSASSPTSPPIHLSRWAVSSVNSSGANPFTSPSSWAGTDSRKLHLWAWGSFFGFPQLPADC